MSLITINDVQIKELTVEIKSLTVGRKQLTLSLMRQFIDESIINEQEMLLKGVPWGFINYFWGEGKNKTPEHYLHLIWQKGSELRRCIIPKKYNSYIYNERIDAAHWSYNEEVKNVISKETEIHEIEKYFESEMYKAHKKSLIPWEKKYSEEMIIRLQILKTELLEAIEDRDYDKKQRYNWICSRDEISKEYEELILSIKDLPHLFIAE